MSDDVFDVVVLGGGSGGYSAALRARQLGLTVALIERDLLGGTCLHRGCVPTKALLHTAEIADNAREAHAVGVRTEFLGVDAEAARAWREKIVAKKFAGLTGLIRARGVQVFAGSGVVAPEGDAIIVDGTQRVVGRDIVIATGGRTRPITGVAPGGRVLTSDTALSLGEIPESVIILGGGVIGVEFASIWRSLGAEVTIVEPFDRLVPGEDEASSAALLRAFRKRGIDVVFGAACDAATPHSSGVEVALSDGSSRTASHVLIAAGRVPSTDGLGLAEAGIEVDDGGFVRVDATLATTRPRIWAVGDIVRGVQLAHRSFAQGLAVAERVAGRQVPALDELTVPRVTYSHPEVASVGMTSAAARALYGDEGVTIAEFPLAANAKSEILGTAGFVRVIRRVEGPVIGVHMVGDRVGELIAEAQLIVGWDAHPEDVAPLIHPHPTQSEALGEALLVLAGSPLHAL